MLKWLSEGIWEHLLATCGSPKKKKKRQKRWQTRLNSRRQIRSIFGECVTALNLDLCDFSAALREKGEMHLKSVLKRKKKKIMIKIRVFLEITAGLCCLEKSPWSADIISYTLLESSWPSESRLRSLSRCLKNHHGNYLCSASNTL